MKVLIANYKMNNYSGITMYVQELAYGLNRKGIKVEVFTCALGSIAFEMIERGIFVTDEIKLLSEPDLIHANHNIMALKTISRFRNTPVLFWVHGRLSSLSIPPFHANVMRYIAVDYNCKELYTDDYCMKESESQVIYNWVNLDRFKLNETKKEKPTRALVFSSYLNENLYLPEIKEACSLTDISLDVIGKNNEISDPESYLGEYDIIFAKAKAAIEGLSIGASVIVCDFMGLAGMIDSSNYERFRKYNFGMKLMTMKVTVENLVREIKKYNAQDAKLVSTRIRSEASYLATIDQIISCYNEVLTEYRNGKRGRYSFNKNHIIHLYRRTFRYWCVFRFQTSFPMVFNVLHKIYSLRLN